MITSVSAGVYTVPTELPEADGTLRWDSTTVVTVSVAADSQTGLGWTYSSPVAAGVVVQHLARVIVGRDPMDVSGAFQVMRRATRNIGTAGLVMQAISAVDIALWDLKAKLIGAPLAQLLGAGRDSVPVYGSGGFTTWDDRQLAGYVDVWAGAGCTAMKIKIGESWGQAIGRDLARVRQLAAQAGPGVQLMVDANGGYTVGQARRVGAQLDELGVVWFEEPVSSDDLGGLAAVRESLRCDVAAGEYVSDVYDCRALAGVVDCMQLDATRCGGYTGWQLCAGVAAAANLQVSAHCAPSLHAPAAAATPHARHIEWFVDHARLEPMLFDGVPQVAGGSITVPADRPGHGLVLLPDADSFRQR